MSKYTFIKEANKDDWLEEGDSKITIEFNAIDLERILQEFESFLRGAGFTLNGHLDIVQEMEWSETHGHEDDLDDIDQFFKKETTHQLNPDATWPFPNEPEEETKQQTPQTDDE
jgi:hypothetical protein